ncbi:hypothetical protein E2H86_18190 [Pseudomonas putida]|uniref:hypothetical protein n=1 Tax=Pseudomonas putida group TaxID=136845 RepID=UPI001059C689|nr:MULTISPECIES: hypothetical protein [Pseudomonas putida group]MBF8745836.1 hypothetical protein [Pseudomonas monteilii]TDJ75109.1 hypothetical protein E2H86_18190 [Pseudomonas putida]
MLKVVPDPPNNPYSLEDTLMVASNYARCAEAVVQQALMMQPASPATVLVMATAHELGSLRKLIASALAQVQQRSDQPRPH